MGIPRCPSTDPIPELRNFEVQLSAALKADVGCRQPIVLLLTDSDGVDRATYDRKLPAWWIFLDFSAVELRPGRLDERYKLAESADSSRKGGSDGQGDPKEIARGVCEFMENGPPLE